MLEQCWKSLGVEGRITISLYGTYVEPARGGRAARADPRGDPLRRPGGRGSRGAQARRGVRADRAESRQGPPGSASLSARGTGTALAGLFLAALALRPQIVGVGPLIERDPGRPRRLARARRPARDDPRALHGALRAGRRVPRGAARHAARDDDRPRADRPLRGLRAQSCRAPGSSSCSRGPSGSGWGSGTPSRRSSCGRRCPSARRPGPASTRPGSSSARPSAAALAVPLAARARRLARRADRALGRARASSRSHGSCSSGAARRHERPSRARPAAPLALAHGVAARRRSSARWRRRTTASTRGCPTRTASAAGATSRPGILLAAMNLTAIPASFLVPWLSDRHGGRRPWLSAMSLVFVTGGVGLVALPGARATSGRSSPGSRRAGCSRS